MFFNRLSTHPATPQLRRRKEKKEKEKKKKKKKKKEKEMKRRRKRRRRRREGGREGKKTAELYDEIDEGFHTHPATRHPLLENGVARRRFG